MAAILSKPLDRGDATDCPVYTAAMIWTLLVPGALVPAELAAGLARALPAQCLAESLDNAQDARAEDALPGCAGAAHWSWLARRFGMGDPPVTAPEAWADLYTGNAKESGAWIAQCDPVHFEATREHVVACDLPGTEPRPDEVAELLDAGLFFLGSPTLNNGLYPSVGEFITYIKGLKPRNKAAVAFGSFGWGGQAVDLITADLKALGLTVPHEGIKVKYIPDPEELNQIRSLSAQLAREHLLSK